ncbi:MAG TPA: methyltransferase domain-containing protein [Baekduia sp.]|uniref:methyltransferase domain-containing protein n=1 Tax=Baekduia sp. TaxID=2600305 RepID=UPI002B7BD8E9|nr:methyltransferase domain-containing protein [Baekduia sp.]HMJ34319.1 methyltransferase domain-containing protein [Baekduia sp.]
MAALPRRLRFTLGRAYAALWRSADGALARLAPGSVRRARSLPRLPAEPVHRRYGLRAGRPVDRFYIERFLERHAGDIRGETLEVLDAVYTRRFGGDAVQRADVLDLDPDNERATVRGDLQTAEGIPAGAFDCFVCTQTISITYDFSGAVKTAFNLLAPGGVLLLTVPGISHQAEPDGERYPDHWRFTWRAIDRLLSERFGADNVEVQAEGTVAASAAFLYGIPASELDPADLDPHDPDYEMVICARAVKR